MIRNIVHRHRLFATWSFDLYINALQLLQSLILLCNRLRFCVKPTLIERENLKYPQQMFTAANATTSYHYHRPKPSLKWSNKCVSGKKFDTFFSVGFFYDQLEIYHFGEFLHLLNLKNEKVNCTYFNKNWSLPSEMFTLNNFPKKLFSTRTSDEGDLKVLRKNSTTSCEIIPTVFNHRALNNLKLLSAQLLLFWHNCKSDEAYFML